MSFQYKLNRYNKIYSSIDNNIIGIEEYELTSKFIYHIKEISMLYGMSEDEAIRSISKTINYINHSIKYIKFIHKYIDTFLLFNYKAMIMNYIESGEEHKKIYEIISSCIDICNKITSNVFDIDIYNKMLLKSSNNMKLSKYRFRLSTIDENKSYTYNNIDDIQYYIEGIGNKLEESSESEDLDDLGEDDMY